MKGIILARGLKTRLFPLTKMTNDARRGKMMLNKVEGAKVEGAKIQSLTSKHRDSNFELIRIFGILLIIAHHYVVNSGLAEIYDFDNITGNMIFLQFFGFGGKMAINIFTLLTGYFMVNSRLRLKKVLQLWLEVMFYDWLINVIFIAIGYVHLDLRYLATQVFPLNLLNGVDTSYTGSLLVFYLLIPGLNIWANNIPKKLYCQTICVLLFAYTIVH